MAKFKTPGGTPITGEYVHTLYKEVDNWRGPYKEKWLDYYKAYRSYRDKSKYPFRSNVYVHYTFSLVETMVPMMLNSAFSADPIVSVTPRKGAVYELAQLLEDVLGYFMDDDRLALYFKYQDLYKETCIYGTSFGRILPRFTKENNYSATTKQVMPVLDYIDFDPIDLFRVYPDWRATDLNDMRFLIIRHEKDIDELYEMAAKGLIDGGKKTVDKLKTEARSPMETDDDKQRRKSEIEQSETYPSTERIVIEVLEYWDRTCTLWVAQEGNVVLREGPNPFDGAFPFVMLQYCRIPHELYGMGLPEMVYDIQEELNTIRNQRLDNVNLIINRMFVANRLADTDFENLVSYAGNVILTNDMDSIKPLETKDITRAAYTEEEILMSDSDNTTGLFRFSRGGPPQRRETATGILRLQTAASPRLDAASKAAEFAVIRQTAKLFIWFIRKFLPPKKMAQIVGMNAFVQNQGQIFYMMPLEDLLKNYHFRQMGSAITGAKEMRAQQLLQAMQMTMGMPGFNSLELLKMIFKEVFSIKNLDRLFPQARPQVPGGMQNQQLLTAPGGAGQPAQGLPGPEPGGSNEGINYETLLRGAAGFVPPGMG